MEQISLRFLVGVKQNDKGYILLQISFAAARLPWPSWQQRRSNVADRSNKSVPLAGPCPAPNPGPTVLTSFLVSSPVLRLGV